MMAKLSILLYWWFIQGTIAPLQLILRTDATWEHCLTLQAWTTRQPLLTLERSSETI